MCSVSITSATSEAKLYGMLFLSTLIHLIYVLVFESFFLPPLLLYGHLLAKD